MDVRRIETLKQNGEMVGNRTRIKVVKNKIAPPFKEAESIQLQNQFLKFLEDYPGKVALHHEYPINVIETISSRLLSIRKKPYLPRLSFGSGISRESKNPVHDASNSLTLKACLSLPYFSPSKKKVLSLLDSL